MDSKILCHNSFAGHRPTGLPAQRPTGNLPVARRASPSLFKSAKVIVRHLEGKHKPVYHPLSDLGDHVVVINTKEIAMEAELWRTFKIFHHTGYPGGFSATRAFKVHDKDPTKMLHKIIYANIKGNLLRKGMMEKLHLFPDDNIPEEILKNITGQIPQVMPLPKRFEDFTPEEREKFPKLFDWPEDYIVKPPKEKS